MQRLGKRLRTSIGKKALMALTGLGLTVFLILHLLGNLTLFAGDAQFTAYAAKLTSNKALVYTAEVGLLLLFLAHIVLAVRTSMENRAARDARYAIRTSKGAKTPGSASMLVTGALIAIFLVIHLLDFRLNREHNVERLAFMVRERLSEPLGIAIYLAGVAAVGLHLSHAVQSAFHTLGVDHPRYVPLIRRGGLALALVLTLGFAAFPILLAGPRPAEVGAAEPAGAPPSEVEPAATAAQEGAERR